MAATCFALDPVTDELASGGRVNRHCLLPAGHEGMHQSRNPSGAIVHEWAWEGEGPARELHVQPNLFTGGVPVG